MRNYRGYGNAFLKDQLLVGLIWWVWFAAPQAGASLIP